MGVAWRRAVAGVLFGMAGLTAAAAQSNDIALVDDSYLYHRDKTSYDSNKDVVVTLGEDIDFGPFWVAMQCGSNAVWFMNKLTGEWKAPEALPDDMKTFHDTLCAQSASLPYLAF